MLVLFHSFCFGLERMGLLTHQVSNTCCAHFPSVCCGTGEVYFHGPGCCCIYPDCREAYCGIESYSSKVDAFGNFLTFEPNYHHWRQFKGCCCNGERFLEGLKKQFSCDEHCEGPNLMFLLTGGCCCGACCLDHNAHIIPCAGAATCFADRCTCCNCSCNEEYGAVHSFERNWSGGHMLACWLSNHAYSGGQYVGCSNAPVCCAAALLAAKFGFGVDPLGIGKCVPNPENMV